MTKRIDPSKDSRIGNSDAGRNAIFTDPDEMQRKIDYYFNSIIRQKVLMIHKYEDPTLSAQQLNHLTEKQRAKKIPAIDCNGNTIIVYEWVTPPHEGDLHRAIGIKSRDTWGEYLANPLFTDTVRNAKRIVEDYYSKEVTKQGSNTNGLKFVLGVCYNWREIQYVQTESVAKLEDLIE